MSKIDTDDMTFTVSMITAGIAIPVLIMQANSIEQAAQVAEAWRDAHRLTVRLDRNGIHVGTYIYQPEGS